MEGTAEPPLPVDHFDPSAALPSITLFAGPGAQLTRIEANYVKSSGHLDLTADYRPTLKYEFVRPRADAESAPVGTGTKGRRFERISISVREPGWVRAETRGGGCENRSGTFKHEGMARDVSFVSERQAYASTSAPDCSMAEVWKQAQEILKAPTSAVAQIEYTKAGYEFEIRDLDLELHLSADCELLSEDEYQLAKRNLNASPEEIAEQAAKAAQRAARDAEREIRRAEREVRMQKKRSEPPQP